MKLIKMALLLAVAGGFVLTMNQNKPVLAEDKIAQYPKYLDEVTQSRITRGLRYLEARQRSDGSWLAEKGGHPMVMTSLAGLAFMASGSTPESGPYSKVVKKAMDYIVKQAKECIKNSKDQSNGVLIRSDGVGAWPMYGHGFAMLFLAQCYGCETKNPKSTMAKNIKDILDLGIRLTAKSQSDLGPAFKHAGGWRYSPGDDGDEGSVTVTQLQALRACRNVGIKVPKKTIERAVLLLQHTQRDDGGIAYQSADLRQSQPALSAAAIVSFYMAGLYDRKTGGKGSEAEMVEKLAQYCRKNNMPMQSNSGHYFYTQFFMAQAMYQRGGKDWQTYFPQIKTKLAELQASDGSWPGDNVGPIYGTSIGCIILQIPYGYLPIIQR